MNEVELFANRIMAALRYCRGKRNGATTFKKLNKTVAMLADNGRPRLEKYTIKRHVPEAGKSLLDEEFGRTHCPRLRSRPSAP